MMNCFSHFSMPCIIFAGGRSSRMGCDKALLPFGGRKTLAEYQYRRLAPLFDAVYLVAKEDKFAFGAPLIYDSDAFGRVYAPTAGLLAALETLQRDFFVLSVDAPFVDDVTIAALVEAYRRHSGASAMIARSPSGLHPLCGIYTMKMLAPLKRSMAKGEHRLHRLLRSEGAVEVVFDNEKVFANLNRPDEYEAALSGNRGGR